jgi:hypothetical protein
MLSFAPNSAIPWLPTTLGKEFALNVVVPQNNIIKERKKESVLKKRKFDATKADSPNSSSVDREARSCETQEDKKKRRLVRNREAAQASREVNLIIHVINQVEKKGVCAATRKHHK